MELNKEKGNIVYTFSIQVNDLLEIKDFQEMAINRNIPHDFTKEMIFDSTKFIGEESPMVRLFKSTQ